MLAPAFGGVGIARLGVDDAVEGAIGQAEQSREAETASDEAAGFARAVTGAASEEQSEQADDEVNLGMRAESG